MNLITKSLKRGNFINTYNRKFVQYISSLYYVFRFKNLPISPLYK
jgi:hypothetical protein